MKQHLVLVLCLAATGCTALPESYAPPIQRRPITALDPNSLSEFVYMNQTNAEAHLLLDVSKHLEGNSWRWTQKKPTFRFQLQSVNGRKFRLDFRLHETILEQTGPLTITVSVDGNVLGRETYRNAGEYRFEKPVPPEWLSLDRAVIVAVELDKVWVSPTDGATLGLILTGAGFIE
jgi:hypothetical protein